MPEEPRIKKNVGGGPRGFKKGVSGNPKGRPKSSFLIEKQRLITSAEFFDLVTKFTKMDRIEIKEYLERPEVTMFELVYGKLVVEAAKGDRSARDMLTERLFGKTKEITENHNLNMNVEGPKIVLTLPDNGFSVAALDAESPKELSE